MHDDPRLPAFTHLAALSGKCDRQHISTANNEVVGMYRLFDANRGRNISACYDGIYKIFLRLDDISSLDDYVDKKFVRLLDENPAR